MPKFSPLVSLDRSLSVLLKRRQELKDRLAEIDAIFAKFGINPDKTPAVVKAAAAAPAKSVGKKRRKRGRFAQTAEEFILGLLDGQTLTSSQINAAWVASGRKNKADNSLTMLFKAKKLKRVKLKGERGSTYSVA